MPQGWLVCPVIGTGVPDTDPFRAAVDDREEFEDGDRLEFVIGEGGECLVGYDVADTSTFEEFEIEPVTVEEAAEIGVDLNPDFDINAHLGEEEAPPPGSFVNDSLTGVDGTSLEAHVGEQGATWKITAAMVLEANRVRGGATTYRYAQASGVPPSPDYSVEVGLFCASIVGGTRRSGPIARQDSNIAVDTSYGFGWETNTGLTLRKRIAGVETVLGTWAHVGEVGENGIAVLSVVGTAIKGFFGGVERIAATDADIATAGRAGFRCQAGAGTSALVDYIIATDLAAGGLAEGRGITSLSSGHIDRGLIRG